MYVLKVYQCVQSSGQVGMLARSISPWVREAKCDCCLQPVSTKDALKRHQQTQSCAKRASELAQILSSALMKYSKLRSHYKPIYRNGLVIYGYKYLLHF